jgi:ribonuclease P protein component
MICTGLELKCCQSREDHAVSFDVNALTRNTKKRDNAEFCLGFLFRGIKQKSSRYLQVESSHETYLPAISRASQENPRFPGSHENRRWPRRHQRPSRQGSCAHSGLGQPAFAASLRRPSVPSLAPDSISTEDASHGRRARFRRQHRLVKYQVEQLLREGARFNRAELALRIHENAAGQGRIAIAVPKRILKSAVDRNYVKRVIREQFRQSGFRALSVDVLVTLRSRVGAGQDKRGNVKSTGGQLRSTFLQLTGDVSQRFGVVA